MNCKCTEPEVVTAFAVVQREMAIMHVCATSNVNVKRTEFDYDYYKNIAFHGSLESVFVYRLSHRFCRHQIRSLRGAVTSSLPLLIWMLNDYKKSELCELNIFLSGVAFLLEDFADVLETSDLLESFRRANEDHSVRYNKGYYIAKNCAWAQYNFWKHISKVSSCNVCNDHEWWFRQEKIDLIQHKAIEENRLIALLFLLAIVIIPIIITIFLR